MSSIDFRIYRLNQNLVVKLVFIGKREVITTRKTTRGIILMNNEQSHQLQNASSVPNITICLFEYLY